MPRTGNYILASVLCLTYDLVHTLLILARDRVSLRHDDELLARLVRCKKRDRLSLHKSLANIHRRLRAELLKVFSDPKLGPPLADCA